MIGVIGVLVCILASLLVALPVSLAWLGAIDRDMDSRGTRTLGTRHPLPRADIRRAARRGRS